MHILLIGSEVQLADSGFYVQGVELNDDTSTVLNVVDIIEFSAVATIAAIRAYKQ